MTTLTEKISIMQAFERGETVEIQLTDGWEIIEEPSWNWTHYEYRIAKPKIKPEPKKVKLLAWLEQGTGYLNFRVESFGEPKHSASVRVPSEDKEITL
jgi:hypothetical protein